MSSYTSRVRGPITLSVALLAACTGEVDPRGTPDVDLPPGTVEDKPVVDTARGPAIASELVLRLALGDEETAAELVAAHGGAIVWRGPRTGAYLARFVDDAAARSAWSALAQRPEVLDVSRNLVADGTGLSSSPGSPIQWNLPAMGLYPGFRSGDASGVQVAVLDTGVAYEDFEDARGVYALAPDLAGVEFHPGHDFVHDDAHPNDDHGHGTHVTGVMASTGSLEAVAPGVEIMPIKVLDRRNRGTELALAEGILFAAEQGADIANMSLSFAPAYFPSRFLQDAVDQASADGVVLIAAAGNHDRDVVTYPAAFREVIAVGASQLEPDIRIGSEEAPWWRAARHLERASYSNRGYLIDVAAPGGSITQDLDGDGNPEAILAQSFAAADPTLFEYTFYAGTSQAAAHVSGAAALALARNPDLEPEEVRALLGETARREIWREPLSAGTGRGFVSGFWSSLFAESRLATRARAHHSASVRLSLVEDGDGRVARASVEVVDREGRPARGVEVFASFTGGVFESVRGMTDGDGRVQFRSSRLSDPRVVAFQVEAVVSGRRWWKEVDRPGGFVRIDSCSLDLLARFADEVAEGSGLSSSPGSPISLGFQQRDADEVDSVLLLNFSWSGATPAMAVVADAGWFGEAFPTAPDLRVTSLSGGGVSHRLAFDADVSFPFEVAASDPGECVDVVVSTFGSGLSSSPGVTPIIPDPDGSCVQTTSCATYKAVFDTLWREAIHPGEVIPAYDTSMGLSEGAYAHVAAMLTGYAGFAAMPYGSPVEEYGDTLDAAGIGVAPYASSVPDDLGVGAASWQEP